MVYNGIIEGRYVNLRSVEEKDAEFLLSVRNNPRISKYLPPLDVTVEQQRQWISMQRADHESYYFLMSTPDGEPIGSISVYDIEGDTAETGRFCSLGDPASNIEAAILLTDFCFDELNLNSIHIWVYEGNKSVLKLNEGLGYEWGETVLAKDGRECRIGRMTKESYLPKRKKLSKMLKLN